MLFYIENIVLSKIFLGEVINRSKFSGSFNVGVFFFVFCFCGEGELVVGGNWGIEG